MVLISKIIQKHKDIESFLDKEVEEDTLKEIIISSQSITNFHEGQNVSIIVVKDTIRKNKIAEILGDITSIKEAPILLVYVVDFYKTYLACKKHNVEQVAHNHIDSLNLASLEAGLVLGASIIIAESKGLGVYTEDSLTDYTDEISKILDLPQYTFPIFGLSIGYSASLGQKNPKLPFPTFYHEEQYQHDRLETYINEYDEIMETYIKNKKDKQESDHSNWTEIIVEEYNKETISNFKIALKNRGFDV